MATECSFNIVMIHSVCLSTVKILLNAQAFIQNSTLTTEGGGPLLEATL